MSRLEIKLPADLKIQAVQVAKAKGKSLSEVIRDCLKRLVNEQES